MLKISRKFFLIVFLAFGFCPIKAQVKAQVSPLGALEVSGRVRIEGKLEKLERKRFYLLRGGLEANKNLIAKLKTAELISRDCFYSQMKASSEFICWLKEEDCESPFCREIEKTDIDTVPEFRAAYQKGLSQYGNRPALAQNWLTTNLASPLRDGFYQKRKSLLESILGGVKPVQSGMIDSKTVRVLFIDIALNLSAADGKKTETETFLVSNLLPIEIGNKSYIWACEKEIKEIGEGGNTKLALNVPEEGKTIKGCEVIIKDLPVCKTEGCKK